jgi:predicted P-loop ATPase
MSERFHVDFQNNPTRDAVTSLALEHCFDPVRDMLDKAEAEYDCVERLDRMAVDYFNCEDTELNRAIIRKTMIAAVRRVRVPGCKFDTITVLESPEGWNKSSAWRVLAGDDNFSDESILGQRGKEVMEQLSEVWIHENADLAGMKKAEVESVKAFASRQVDIARMAYGHFVTKQKRHSIEVGTTNSDEYLQSQTGNRRFWPLAVLSSIDLDKLRRDRLRLFGEAAKLESSGENLTLDESLWPKARDEQEKRRTKDPWEDIVAIIPAKTPLDFNGDERGILEIDATEERVASSDLLTFVLRIPIGLQKTQDSMRLATAMKNVGWKRNRNGKVSIGGQQVRGYFRPINPPANPPVKS